MRDEQIYKEVSLLVMASQVTVTNQRQYQKLDQISALPPQKAFRKNYREPGDKDKTQPEEQAGIWGYFFPKGVCQLLKDCLEAEQHLTV